jgi:hypothetical protein
MPDQKYDPKFENRSYSVSRQLELNPHMSRADSRLPQDTDLMARAPEIDGFQVSGPMTNDMFNAKGGQWQFVGRKPDEWADWDPNSNPYGTNVRHENVWMFRENAPAAAAAPAARKEAPPPPASPKGTIYDSWEDYQTIARNDTEGLNRMPFIGPQGDWGRETYGNVPMDPLLALEMFYPGALNQWGEKLRDPLDGALLDPVAK